MKTSELSGAALDWAVAKCEETRTGVWATARPPAYSSDWSLAGRIIEKEWLEIGAHGDQWRAVMHLEDESVYADGSTPLIAAMRCYVASKLGDEVEIPEELK